MPYIHNDKRELFAHVGSNGRHPKLETKGELNYEVTLKALKYIKTNGVGYKNISDAIAALQDAADELKRRLLHPYEDAMIKKNGDLDLYKELIEEVKRK